MTRSESMQGFAICIRCLAAFMWGDGNKLQKGAFSSSRDFLIFSS